MKLVNQRFTRKFTTLLLAFGLMVSQSGCLVGFIVQPLIIPFVASGTALGVAGGIMIGAGAYKRDDVLAGVGSGMLLAGAILDQDNPGQIDALNPISRDKTIARELDVTLDDITDYNNNLNQVREVALDLSNDLRVQLRRPEFKKEPKLEDLARDCQIDALARKYGFNSSREFVETFKYDRLSQETLERFSQATRLNPAEAKILLRYGFAVKSI